MRRRYQKFCELSITSDVKAHLTTKELNKIVADAIKTVYKERFGYEPEVNISRKYLSED